MIDIGWSELLVIGVVALIVVGPKDLPMMFRRLGEFTGKARAMAREFSSAMEKAADDAGVKDVQKTFRDATNPKKMGLDAINKTADEMTRWDQDDAAATMKKAEKPPLSEERADAAGKVSETSARKAEERTAREAGSAAGKAEPPKPDAAGGDDAGATTASENEKTA